MLLSMGLGASLELIFLPPFVWWPTHEHLTYKACKSSRDWPTLAGAGIFKGCHDILDRRWAGQNRTSRGSCFSKCCLRLQEMTNLDEAMKWRIHETGYSGIHSTKPQTLSYALTDSPVGPLPALSWRWQSVVLASCISQEQTSIW